MGSHGGGGEAAIPTARANEACRCEVLIPAALESSPTDGHGTVHASSISRARAIPRATVFGEASAIGRPTSVASIDDSAARAMTTANGPRDPRCSNSAL